MKKKVFVGNLSWKVTEDNLKPLFDAYGTVVSIKIITDQYTGKSKGFGFVEMETSEGADKAIAELNGKQLLDREMRVSLAQERSERQPAGNGGPRGDRGDRGDRGGPGGNKPFRPRGDRF